MITTKDNLFHACAQDVAKGDCSELYLIAGNTFSVLQTSAELRRVLEVATSVANTSKASDALRAHYHSLQEVRESQPVFTDGSSGLITCDRIVVQFDVRLIGANSDTYRVLFVRVDAEELAVDFSTQLKNLQRRVAELERAS